MNARAVLLFALSLGGCGACGKNRGLAFDPPSLPDGAVGQPYHVEIKALDTHTPVGGMGLVEDGAALPPGLAFRFDKQDETGVIEGTPTAAGTFDLTISAWCYGTNVSGQTGQHPYRITIR